MWLLFFRAAGFYSEVLIHLFESINFSGGYLIDFVLPNQCFEFKTNCFSCLNFWQLLYLVIYEMNGVRFWVRDPFGVIETCQLDLLFFTFCPVGFFFFSVLVY